MPQEDRRDIGGDEGDPDGAVRVSDPEVDECRPEHHLQDGDGVATPRGQRPRGHEHQRDQSDIEWPTCGLTLRGEVRTQQYESGQADR